MPPGRARAAVQTPKAVDAGAVTDRLTAGMPTPAGGQRLTPQNFIDEQIFEKMQRDGIPHDPD